LCETRKCVPWTLFANGNTTPRNQPANPKTWLKTYNNKPIYRTTTFKLSTQQTNRWEVEQTLEAVVLPPTEIPPPWYGEIYIIVSNPPLNTKQYR